MYELLENRGKPTNLTTEKETGFVGKGKKVKLLKNVQGVYMSKQFSEIGGI